MPYSSTVKPAEQELERRVRNQLYRRSELRGVEVRAEDGALVLDGRVPTFYLKQLCISGSRRVAGVQRLVDRISVE